MFSTRVHIVANNTKLKRVLIAMFFDKKKGSARRLDPCRLQFSLYLT
jgi:molybdopterin/thiamine biosynthesis adenylyltransferase